MKATMTKNPVDGEPIAVCTRHSRVDGLGKFHSKKVRFIVRCAPWGTVKTGVNRQGMRIDIHGTEESGWICPRCKTIYRNN